MSTYNEIMNILKMGVQLPEGATEEEPRRGNKQHLQAIGREGSGIERVFHSPKTQERFKVPFEVGVGDENPDDPHHGLGPAPAWEGEGHGYHPDVHTEFAPPDEPSSDEHESMLDMIGMGDETNKPKTQMLQQLEGGAHERVGPSALDQGDMKGFLGPELKQMAAHIQMELQRRATKRNQ